MQIPMVMVIVLQLDTKQRLIETVCKRWLCYHLGNSHLAPKGYRHSTDQFLWPLLQFIGTEFN